MDTHWYTVFDSPLGSLSLVATEKGLRAIYWHSDQTILPQLPNSMTEQTNHPLLRQATQQISEYFIKKRTVFDLPLDLRGTPFQIAVWQSLRNIPYGSTLSYKKQAELIGQPKAVRAVGQANRRNPVPILLPCHRVIESNGNLGGFGSGIDRKLTLLKLEGSIN